MTYIILLSDGPFVLLLTAGVACLLLAVAELFWFSLMASRRGADSACSVLTSELRLAVFCRSSDDAHNANTADSASSVFATSSGIYRPMATASPAPGCATTGSSSSASDTHPPYKSGPFYGQTQALLRHKDAAHLEDANSQL